MPHGDMTTDVLIIGSGPIGATFARILVEAGRKVTMIDSGKQLSDRPGEHLRNSFRYQQEPNMFTDTIMSQLEEYSVPSGMIFRPSAVRYNFENPNQKWWRNMPAASAVYAVGGMGTLWTASTPDPVPFERASFIPDDDWKHMLDLAKRLLKVNKYVMGYSLLGPIVLDRYQKKGFTSIDWLQQAAEKFHIDETGGNFIRWTGVDTILGPLLDDPKYQSSFQLLAEHRAEALNKSDGEHKITSASVRDLHTWTSFKIYADTFIVAGGSFNTPTLLWASGICPPALGRYLNDNLEASCHVDVDAEIIEAMKHIPGYTHFRDAVPIMHNDPGPALGSAPTPERPWHGQIHRLARQFIYMPGEDVRYQVHFTWYGTVDIQYDNHIRWDGKKDRFGMPQVTIDFFYSRQDILRAVRMWWDMIKTARVIGRIHGIPMISPPGSTLHLQGTYRMGGKNDGESVTDSFSNVWDMDNLYLGGLGIIPTSMASNPTLTAVAYAVRAAARLIGKTLPELAQNYDRTSDDPVDGGD